MTTATKSKTAAEQAAEAEQKAAELRATADAERRAAEQAHAAWQAERDRLTPEFWEEQRSTFSDRHRGKVEQTWQEFAAAVRAGNPGVPEWVTYAAAVKWRHADKLDLDGYFLTTAIREYERRAEVGKALHPRLKHGLVGGGSTERRTASNMELSLDEWRRRRRDALDDAKKALGQSFDEDNAGVLKAMHALPAWIGRRPATMGHQAAAERDPQPHGVRTYAEAVSKVTEAAAAEAVEQHQADRKAALVAWLDQRTGPAPQ